LESLLDALGRADVPILVRGEPGVGKTSYVGEIHARSSRAGRPLVRLSARDLPHEDALFGSDSARDEGVLARADGGTVIVEDVDDLPSGVDQRFLRFLRTGELVARSGSRVTRRIDARVLATSAAHERSRSALVPPAFAMAITLPPLRERLDDVEALARHFASSTHALSGDAIERLRAHSWPGNTRELRDVVEGAVSRATSGEVLAEHVLLPDEEGPPSESERLRLVSALGEAAWNQSRAAEILGVSRRTIIRRMERFGIPRPRKG
jgi:DNA-binding NtrC family response regulator